MAWKKKRSDPLTHILSSISSLLPLISVFHLLQTKISSSLHIQILLISFDYLSPSIKNTNRNLVPDNIKILLLKSFIWLQHTYSSSSSYTINIKVTLLHTVPQQWPTIIHSWICSVLFLPETEFCSFSSFCFHGRYQSLAVVSPVLPYTPDKNFST